MNGATKHSLCLNTTFIILLLHLFLFPRFLKWYVKNVDDPAITSLNINLFYLTNGLS